MISQLADTCCRPEVPGPLFLGLSRTLVALLLLVIPWSLALAGYVGALVSLLGWVAYFTVAWRRPGIPRRESAWALAWALGSVTYAVLHLVQIKGLAQARELEASSRLLLLSGIVFVPWLGRMAWRDFALPLAWSGMCFGGIALLHPVAADPDRRVFGFYSYANMMGFAPMITALMLAAVIPDVKRWKRAWVVLGMLGALVASFLSGTRGAWPAALILLAMLWRQYQALHLNSATKPSGRLKGAMLVGLVAFLFAASPAIKTRWTSTWKDVQQLSQGDDRGSIGARISMARLATEMIREHPWRGNGLAEYHRRVQIWADAHGLPPDASERGFQNPHNQYLHWGQALGLPVALLCLTFTLIVAWQVAIRSRGAERLALWATCGSTAIFLCSEAILDRHHGSQWFAVVFGLSVGMAIASSSSDHI